MPNQLEDIALRQVWREHEEYMQAGARRMKELDALIEEQKRYGKDKDEPEREA
jgi:hypothetical protein